MTEGAKRLLLFLCQTKTTRAEFAQSMEIHRMTVGRWLAGDNIPSDKQKLAIEKMAHSGHSIEPFTWYIEYRPGEKDND